MNKQERDDLVLLLNDKLAEQLLKKIQDGEATAQDLNVARQYLKDNNISALISEYEDPEQDSPAFKLADEITKELNDFDQKSA